MKQISIILIAIGVSAAAQARENNHADCDEYN